MRASVMPGASAMPWRTISSVMTPPTGVVRVCNATGWPDASTRSTSAVGMPSSSQPLPCRLRQCRVSGGLDRQVLLLRAQPFGIEQLGQWRAGRHDVTRRAAEHPFDEACGARLHDGNVTLIQLHRAHRFDRRAERALFHVSQAQPQRLLRLRRDGQCAGCTGRSARSPAFVGITRHQLHVHERRLAGFVEALRWHHRVVPVQHLAFVGRCRGLRWGCAVSGRRLPALPLAEAPSGQAGQAQQRDGANDACICRGHGDHSAIKVFRRTRSAARCASRSIRRSRVSTASRRATSTAPRSPRPAW